MIIEKYINQTPADVELFRQQINSYYHRALRGLLEGSKSRILGVAETDFMPAVAELVHIVSTLKGSYGMEASDTQLARIAFHMNFKHCRVDEFVPNSDFYVWPLLTDLPIRVLSVSENSPDDDHKYSLNLIDTSRYGVDDVGVYREYADNEKDNYLASDLQNRPPDWRFRVQEFIKRSDNPMAPMLNSMEATFSDIAGDRPGRPNEQPASNPGSNIVQVDFTRR